jgi:urate oxidase
MLAAHSHGKGSVCVLRLFRTPARHELVQFEVDTELVGPVDESFTQEDNSKVVATDTQKNTIFLLSQKLDLEHSSREDFAILLARHFVQTYPKAVHSCNVRVTETIWERLRVGGQPHQHAFRKLGTLVGHSLVAAAGAEGRITRVESGVRGLTILKTTQCVESGASFVFARPAFVLLNRSKR